MRLVLAALFVFGMSCKGTIGPPYGSGGGGGGADGGASDADGGDVTGGGADARPGAADAAPIALSLAAGIHIMDIRVYQAIQINIVEDGAVVADADRGSHVIAGQDARVGVFVDVADTWQPREVEGELIVEVTPGNEQRFTTRATIANASGTTPDSAGLMFTLPGSVLTSTTTYSLTITEVAPGITHEGAIEGARFPRQQGTLQDMEVRAPGPLNLVLVPFQYNSDGSGRMPPLDDTAMGYYRDLFSSMFPTGDVKITVREAVPYNNSISGGGGWGTWLDALTSLRNSDNPPANTYYYGIAAPRTSFNAFCSGGCTIGLGWVPGRDDEYGRAAVGVSFPDRVGTYTAAHEIGHTLGRSHAPCGGPSGVDGNYPYSGARIGVWGYYAATREFKGPSDYTDVMGYCSDQWISDYTHDGIFHRLTHVNQNVSAFATPRRYRVGIVDGAGKVTWTRHEDITARVSGEHRRIAMRDQNGGDMGDVDGHFYPYDHLPGGMLLVPVVVGPQPSTVQVDGIGTTQW